MSLALRAASVLVTLALLGGAFAVGGGIPLSPGRVAAETRTAADNAAIAADNTDRAVRDTEALADIARNVVDQKRTSEELLATQLELEASSRRGARRAAALQDRLRAVRDVLLSLVTRMRSVASTAGESSAITQRTAAAATGLDALMARLEATFAKVTEESRELNRKARGYDRVSP